MEKRKREILALCLLVLLGISVGSVMAWYIIAGHSWNKAASHIDDLAGTMEGYTVFVFEGVIPQSETLADNRLSKDGSKASSAFSEKASVRGVSIEEAVSSYREKGAHVITLDIKNIGRYEDPYVLIRGDKRYGITAAPGQYRYVTVRDKVKRLHDAAADFTVVLADRADIKGGWLRDIDVVIIACNARIPEEGMRRGETFFVESPYVGEVQAVIVSPSGTIVSKTIEEL